MTISLTKATLLDATEIHKMQIEAFTPLLNRYHDAEINPASENSETVKKRFLDENSHYFLF
jgi:hypothetical protein